jgi:hypothetical protein
VAVISGIRARAEEELRVELMRPAIDAEKARIRAAIARPSWWRRLLNLFPYTITITRRNPK